MTPCSAISASRGRCSGQRCSFGHWVHSLQIWIHLRQGMQDVVVLELVMVNAMRIPVLLSWEAFEVLS